MHSKNLTRIVTSGLLALLFTLPAAAANLAGTVVFASGKPTATGAAGNVRELKAGDKLYSGALVETKKGRVQIKFLDGAFMSIQPNTRFQVEDYNYSSGSDGSEKAVYNLFKGGMRAFTGAIGKKNPDAYKVKTPVATIGIRGTGHNTRICAGDCTGSDGLPLPDGLYHSTWEGTTTVGNESGTSEVPFGNSVYVEGIDTPAEETNEASQVTAVQPSGDSVEELVDGTDDQATLEAGDQVNPDGTPDDIPDGSLNLPTAFSATTQEDNGFGAELNLVSIAPPQPGAEDPVDISKLLRIDGLQTTVFFGEDERPVGTYGTEVNDGPPGYGALATIDPLSILASTSPDAADAQALINAALANPDPDIVALFEMFFAGPASSAEFTVASNIGFGRWVNGKVLLLDSEGGVFLKMLSGNQALHYIFGNRPADAALNATGRYDFIGGTDSTTTSGGAINGVAVGLGATEGAINVNFGAGTGDFVLKVSHGLLYTLEGPLLIGQDFPSLFASVGAIATTTSGNCSQGGCDAFVEGSFFGQQANRGGPEGAGLEYDIEDGGDVITGVAAFTNTTPAPTPLTMLEFQSFLVVETNLIRDQFDIDNADGGSLTGVTVLTGGDRDGNNGLIASFGMEVDDSDGSGFEETLDLLVTIDPLSVLNVDMPDANVLRAQEFIEDALVDDDQDVVERVNTVVLDPATVSDHVDGTFGTTKFAFGTWTDGHVLFIDEVLDGPNAGDRTVEVDKLEPNNFLHYLYGDASPSLIGSEATGRYDLLPEKGTFPTDTHDGFTSDTRPVSGNLLFDFVSLNGRIVDLIIDHDDRYTINGDLMLDFENPGQFYDVENRVTAVTGEGGDCFDAVCQTLIEGSFFGNFAGAGVVDAPEVAGLDYEILTVPFVEGDGNSIIGNAIFGRSGPAGPIPDTYEVIPDQGTVVVLPNPDFPFDPDFADVGLFVDTTNITGDDRENTNGLLTSAGFESDEDTFETFFVVATIDPAGTLAVIDADPNVIVAQGLITDALVSDPLLVANVIASPAKLAEYFQGDGFAYGRWADGNVLVVDENVEEGGPGGIKTVELLALENYQSLAFVTGDSPATPQEGATGRYTFVGGTQSTTVSGASMGQGVIDGGYLDFYFDATPSGYINMTVNHLTDYHVTGGLAIAGIEDVNPGTFSDNGVMATTVGGNCNAGCSAFIDGGFAGALSGGPGGSPAHAGLEYDIADPVDGIIGVAVFERTSDAPQ